MSTRAYLMIKNGNEVRYCFTHWDGYAHGEQLQGITPKEIEAIWNTLGDTSKSYYFDTFYSEKGRQELVDFYEQRIKESPKSSDIWENSLERYKKYKPIPELAGEKPDSSTSGIFTLEDGKIPMAAKGLAPMTGEAWIFIEFVWLYDMQTGKIYYYTCWHPEHLSKKKFAVEYKRHIYRGENFCND